MVSTREFGAAYIYPIIAATLMMENKNSPSPYPLTPNKLIAMIPKRKIVTKIA